MPSERLGWIILGVRESGGSGWATPPDHQDMLAGQHRLSMLIGHLAEFHDDSMVRRLRTVLFLLDRHTDRDGVADQHGLDEAKTVIAVRESLGIDIAGCHPDRDA